MIRARLLSATLLGIVVVGSLGRFALAAQPSTKPAESATAASPGSVLSPRHRDWLEEVAVLISEEEKQAFLALTKDYQRDAFIERFWRERDPYPETGRNELKERWVDNVKLARSTFRRMDDDRVRVLLLNGEPVVRRQILCSASFWPLELWFYVNGSDLYRSAFAVVFFQNGGRNSPYRLWHSSRSRQELVSFDSQGSCRPDDVEFLRAAIRWIDEEGEIGYATLLQKVTLPTAVSREWVLTFNSYSTDLPAGAETFAADISLDFPGWYQNRTVVQGLVAVPLTAVRASELGGGRSFNFVLTGEILGGDTLFDSFRYKFDLPASELASEETLPLVFQRYLRPNPDYTLILKLEDLASGRFWRLERPLDVPKITNPEITPPVDPRLARVLEEANQALASGETSVKLVPPMGDLLTGQLRFDTIVIGDAVKRVRFELDGVAILNKNRPPFSVELDLGDFPRTHVLRATAYGASDEELASDEQLLNVAGSRFRVRLIEPHRGKKYEKSLRARAEVEVPRGEAVERVEFFLNETLVATLFQPPYVQPIVLPPNQDVLFVRALAHRTDGGTSEDVVFVNTPGYSEDIAINLVELYTSVLDRQGRPVTGLAEADFRVKEDGLAQEISRFEPVRDLPIHTGILLDTSSSMTERMETARAAALSFFEASVRPRDRVALITFNDRPYLAIPFTNDRKAFGIGLAGLKAERGTAFYDSLIYSLFYFTGITGQRALIILSDGKDESSRFDFDQALDYARRAGITLYTIALGLPKKEVEAKRALTRLADETGGRSFFVESEAELAAIYAKIDEELRSQYLIAYQSSNNSRDRKYRAVDLEVDRRGVEIKTLTGYYP